MVSMMTLPEQRGVQEYQTSLDWLEVPQGEVYEGVAIVVQPSWLPAWTGVAPSQLSLPGAAGRTMVYPDPESTTPSSSSSMSPMASTSPSRPTLCPNSPPPALSGSVNLA